MDPQPLRHLIRVKLADGRLPADNIRRLRGGVGAGETCDACEKIITVAQFIFGGTSESNREIQMHVTCFRIWDDERLVVKRAPDSMTVVDKIREKIAAGKLPTHDAWKRWAGPGNGAACDACDAPITDLQYEFDDGDGRVFRFHRPCIVAWDRIRGEHA